MAISGSFGRANNTGSAPELEWHARAIPRYDYLLENGRPAAMLAGGHCLPIMLPEAARMIWLKLHSSARRSQDPTRAEKDLVQAVTCAALLYEQDNASLRESFRIAPEVLPNAAFSRLPRIFGLLAEHPQTLDAFRALGEKRRGKKAKLLPPIDKIESTVMVTLVKMLPLYCTEGIGSWRDAVLY